MEQIKLYFIIFGCFMAWTWAESIKLATKNFQINFLNAMEEIMDKEAIIYIDQLLDDFSSQKQFESYDTQLKKAKEAKQLEAKIVLAKQLIDLSSATLETDTHFFMLRNVNFFKKLKQQLKKLEAESFSELRELRMYRTCRQFKLAEKKAAKEKHRFMPYPLETKLVPINEHNIGNALEQLNAKENYTVKVDIKSFGNKLYEQVKEEGAEIIDDYLNSVRTLLQEVIDEKSENEQHSDKLNKLMDELTAIMNMTDFFEKRQKLYAYLETGLVEDYEQFTASENDQKDIAEIFEKLKARGLDLFVTFLFSNFQFLEHLHSEWRKLLPEAPVSLYDDQTKQLHDIHHHYNEFKNGEDSQEKYDKYMNHVKNLYDKTALNNPTIDHTHVFELLHNSSLNLGSVTMNMIKSKCEEF